MKRRKIFNIARIVIFIIFLGITVFLIIESLTPQDSSAAQSNQVGNAIVDAVNEVSGDQAEDIKPTSVSIKNKIDKVNTLSKMTLELYTLPENTKYKSYTYESSDSSIARVDDLGNIEFLSAGMVAISAINTYDCKIKDSFNVIVEDILATNIDLAIDSEKDSTGAYILYIGSTYNLSGIVYPEDATHKEICYQVEDNPYISLIGGRIHVFGESLDNTIEIHAIAGTLDEVILVKTKAKEVKEVALASMELSDIEGYIDSTIALNSYITFSPLDATNKEFEIVEIKDEEIAKAYGNKAISLLSIGETELTIRSIDNEIEATAKITVVARPEVTDFNLSLAGDTILIDEEKKLSIIDILPLDAQIENPMYEVSDTNILSVDDTGTLKGKALGKATVSCTIGSIQRSIEVEVLSNLEDTTDFTISYTGEEEPYIEALKSIDLFDYFTVLSFTPSSPKDDTIIFNLVDGEAILEDNILTPTSEGLCHLEMIHKSSGIKKDIYLRVYSLVSFILKKEVSLNSLEDKDSYSSDLYLNHEYTYILKTDSLYSPIVEINNDTLSLIQNDYELTLFARKIGESELTIYPTYNGAKVDSAKKVISFKVGHKYMDALDIHLNITSNINGTTESINPDILNLYPTDTIVYNIGYSEDVTLYNVAIESSNPDIVSISNQNLILHSIGDSILTFYEEYSQIERVIEVHVRNVVVLNKDNNILIEGNYKFDGKTITITNGEAITIRYNFLNESTIKSITYTIGDEKIAKVGSDGVLTPLSSGTTTLKMEVKDSYGTIIESELTLVVRQKDIIENITDFIYIYVRKGLGHFGIFLILAIFAGLSIFMFFKNDKWYYVLIKISILFIYGFLFAGLTELLQTFVPGRFGLMSDVWVDFSGYASSALLLSIGFILYLYFKKRKEKKNIEEEEDESVNHPSEE